MLFSPKNHHNLIKPQPKLHILQVHTLDQFQYFSAGIADLLSMYRSVLLDDFCEADSPQQLRNTATYMPWLWLLVEHFQGLSESAPMSLTKKHATTNIALALTNANPNVYGLASLSEIIPGRHAFVHGVAHPGIRRNPKTFELGELVLRVAFNELNVHKVKAEIEADNRGAQGYCRRMGFVREAHFKRDNRINGHWKDVLVYSLFQEQFQARQKHEQ